MNDINDDLWCDEQRIIVSEYLARQKLKHGEVGERPAWYFAPYVAIWAIESVIKPGWVGWWAISGDLPTDYTSCGAERHPRAGMRAIAERWKDAAPLLAEGQAITDWSLGSPEEWIELAPLLASRADMLLSFIADDALWTD